MLKADGRTAGFTSWTNGGCQILQKLYFVLLCFLISGKMKDCGERVQPRFCDWWQAKGQRSKTSPPASKTVLTASSLTQVTVPGISARFVI
jgi:hypothetical protein